MAQSNPYPLRVNKEMFEKFKIVAKANGRSVNKEIEQLMYAAVQSYESTHGPISVPNLPQE